MSLLDLEKEDAVERSEVTFVQPYLHPDLGDPGLAVSGNLVNSVWCGYSGSPVMNKEVQDLSLKCSAWKGFIPFTAIYMRYL